MSTNVPSTPFVADFLGKANVLQGDRAGRGTVSRRAAPNCDCRRTSIAAGRSVRIYMRPEDRHVEGDIAALPNRLRGRIARIDYLGTFCLAELRCEALGQPMLISYSLNQLHDLGVREGGEVEIALRVDRVRVFADQAAAHEAAAMSAAGGAPRDAPSRRRGLRWRPRRWPRAAGWLLLAAALFVFLTVPLAMILVRSVEGRGGEFVGLANFVQYVQTPALAQSTRNTLVFALLTTRGHSAAGVRLRLRDPAQPHPVQGNVAQHRDDPDPGAVAAGGDLVHLPVRQPGRAQVHARLGRAQVDLRHAGDGAGDDVCVVSACA